MRVRADQALHRLDRFFGAAELVIGPRLLIEHLVAVLVIRVLGEQFVVQSDCLERPRGIPVGGQRTGLQLACRAVRRDFVLRRRAALKILFGLPSAGVIRRRGRVGRVGAFRGGHRLRLDGALADPELLFELQVRQAPHRLRCHRRFRCFLQKTPVVLHRLFEALFDFRLLHIRAHLT